MVSLNGIFGIILIIFGIYLLVKNKENVFSDLKFNVFDIERFFALVSIFLIIIGIILILW